VKTLYLIRHAKSSWQDILLEDFDRPLNKRGRTDAPFMAKKLRKLGIMPDIIISSPAKRTKETAKFLVEEIGYKKDVVFDKGIYESNISTLNKIIKAIDDKNDSSFLIGHNPTLNIFVENYVEMYDNIPTLGIIVIEFDCDKWEDISTQNGSLKSFMYPKKYK